MINGWINKTNKLKNEKMPRNFYTPDEEPNPGLHKSEQEEQDELDEIDQINEDLAMEEGED